VTSEPATAAFDARCETERAAVESRLAELLAELASEHDGMREAVSYSLLAGGKRLRPILCLWSHDLVGGSRRDVAMDGACAIECVHTYSLIHDDLPCMDDDDYRRGKPSAHKKFGEATAVLAGDALLTLAFQIVATIPERLGAGRPVDAGSVVEMTGVLSGAAGTGGLITGQMLDLAGSGRTGTVEQVRRIHQHKTARLIAASMEIGAVAGGAGGKAREHLREAGMLAGEAFQIVDDVLDCVTDRETLGKTPGKDATEDKLTYPAVVGIDRAREEAGRLAGAAKEALAAGEAASSRQAPDAGEAGRWMRAMFDFVVERGA
jgi:geranylgeranyl diphosphate synthase type II